MLLLQTWVACGTPCSQRFVIAPKAGMTNLRGVMMTSGSPTYMEPCRQQATSSLRAHLVSTALLGTVQRRIGAREQVLGAIHMR